MSSSSSESKKFLATLHKTKNVKRSLQALYNTGKPTDELNQIVKESSDVLPSLSNVGNFDNYKRTKYQLHKREINEAGLKNIQTNDELKANINNHKRRLNIIDDLFGPFMEDEPGLEQKKTNKEKMDIRDTTSAEILTEEQKTVRANGDATNEELLEEASLIAPVSRTTRKAYDLVTEPVEKLTKLEGVDPKKKELPKEEAPLNEIYIPPPTEEKEPPPKTVYEKAVDSFVSTAGRLGMGALSGNTIDKAFVKKTLIDEIVNGVLPTNMAIAHGIGTMTRQPTPNMIAGMAIAGYPEMKRAGTLGRMSDYAKSFFTNPEEGAFPEVEKETPTPMTPTPRPSNYTPRPDDIGGTSSLPPRFSTAPLIGMPTGVANQFAYESPSLTTRISPLVQSILSPGGVLPPGTPGQPQGGRLAQQAFQNYIQDVSVPYAVR